MEDVVQTIMFQYWEKYKPIRDFLLANGFVYHSRDSYTDGNGIVVSVIEHVIDLPQQQIEGVPIDEDKLYYRGRINYSHLVFDSNEVNIVHFNPKKIDEMIFLLLMIKQKLTPKFKVSKPMDGELKGTLTVKLEDDSMLVKDFLNSFGWANHSDPHSDPAYGEEDKEEDNGFGSPELESFNELDMLQG